MSDMVPEQPSIAMSLILCVLHGSFYKFYMFLWELVEHFLTTSIMVVVTSLIMIPPLFLVLNPPDDIPDEVQERNQPFTTIIVLVCAVVGGLFVVILFILICKHCVSKHPRLSGFSSGSTYSGKLADPLPSNRPVYRSIPTPNVERWLQQPNNQFASGRDPPSAVSCPETELPDGNRQRLLRDLERKIAEDADIQELARRISDRFGNDPELLEQLFPKCISRTILGCGIPFDPPPKIQVAKRLSNRNSSVSSAQTVVHVGHLKIDSLDSQENAPPSRAQTNAFLTVEQSSLDQNHSRTRFDQQRSNSYLEVPTGSLENASETRRASYEILGRLPRSRQSVVERRSPPEQRRSSITTQAHPSYKHYPYSRTVDCDKAAATQAFRERYSRSDVGTDRRRNNLVRQTNLIGDHHIIDIPDPPALTLTQHVVQIIPPADYDGYEGLSVPRLQLQPSSLSGSSDLDTPKRIGLDCSGLKPLLRPESPIHSMSCETPIEHEERRASLKEQISRKTKSLEHSRAEELVRLHGGRSLISTAGTEVGLNSQWVAPIQQRMETECRALWSLRSTLADKEFDYDSPGVIVAIPTKRSQSVESLVGIPGGGENTSYTTSFESNTDLTAADDLSIAKGHRRRSSFLELPPGAHAQLTHETRRLRYRRKGSIDDSSFEMHLNSFESTGTESTRPDYPASFESNVSAVSNVSNVSNNSVAEQSDGTTATTDSSGKKKIGELKHDSGYKSQSTDRVLPAEPEIHPKVPDLRDETSLMPTQSRAHELSRERKNADAFFRSAEETDSKSGSESDHGRKAHFSYSFTHGDSRQDYSRDPAIDARSDALFKEFSRYDPRLDVASARRPTRWNSENGGEVRTRRRLPAIANAKRAMFSQEDSIEEELISAPYPPRNIPTIQLPDGECS